MLDITCKQKRTPQIKRTQALLSNPFQTTASIINAIIAIIVTPNFEFLVPYSKNIQESFQVISLSSFLNESTYMVARIISMEYIFLKFPIRLPNSYKVTINSLYFKLWNRRIKRRLMWDAVVGGQAAALSHNLTISLCCLSCDP